MEDKVYIVIDDYNCGFYGATLDKEYAEQLKIRACIENSGDYFDIIELDLLVKPS